MPAPLGLAFSADDDFEKQLRTLLGGRRSQSTARILEVVEAEVTRRVSVVISNMAAMQQHDSGSAIRGEEGLLTDLGGLVAAGGDWETSMAHVTPSPGLDTSTLETPAAQIWRAPSRRTDRHRTSMPLGDRDRERCRRYHSEIQKKAHTISRAQLQADVDSVSASNSAKISQSVLKVVARDINRECGEKTHIQYQHRDGRTFQDVRKEIIEYMDKVGRGMYTTTPQVADDGVV